MKKCATFACEMGRVLALDYGTVRTGIAVTDEMQLIASGLTTISTDELIPWLREYLASESVDIIVIGEPRQMDSSPSEIEQLIVPLIDRLRTNFPKVKIERQDERFTSKMATQTLLDSGLKKKKRRSRELLDEVSATLILQSYLNRLEKK